MERENDRISELPDDLLIRVLSLLTMRESGMTSVLSRRWRYVWAYVSNELNFDASKELKDLRNEHLHTPTYNLALKEAQSKYLRWVNQFVSTHMATTIDEFIVRFPLSATESEHIDNWIKFASDKGVKSLVLDFCVYFMKNPPPYSFTSSYNSSMKSLTSLELSYVEVTGQVLEKILYDCHSLKHLCVSMSNSLVDFKVNGASLQLKSLGIQSCYNLRNLEISAPNLVSLDYNQHGRVSHFPFRNTPNLIEHSQ